MRRVLVTGATSTIGAKVVGRRCERRVRARAFVRGAGKAGALLDEVSRPARSTQSPTWPCEPPGGRQGLSPTARGLNPPSVDRRGCERLNGTLAVPNRAVSPENSGPARALELFARLTLG